MTNHSLNRLLSCWQAHVQVLLVGLVRIPAKTLGRAAWDGRVEMHTLEVLLDHWQPSEVHDHLLLELGAPTTMDLPPLRFLFRAPATG